MLRSIPLLAAVSLLGAMTWPSQGAATRAPEQQAGVCERLTPSGMMHDPKFAAEWGAALQSADPREVARAQALLEQLRAAHGCGDDSAAAEAPDDDADAATLPPGHPPIAGHAAPGLPPGHPPIGAHPVAPPAIFDDAPQIVTI